MVRCYQWVLLIRLMFNEVVRRALELQETKYCMPYPTPVFKQHYMLQELGMACNTWFLVVLARASYELDLVRPSA